MRLYISILVTFLLIVTSGCNIEEKIVVGNPQSLKFGGLQSNVAKISTEIPIENKKPFKIQIEEIDIIARINGRYLGKITLSEPVDVLPKSKNIYPVNLNLEIKNMLLGASVFYNFSHKKEMKISFEGYLQAKYLLFKKKVPINEPDITKYMQ